MKIALSPIRLGLISCSSAFSEAGIDRTLVLELFRFECLRSFDMSVRPVYRHLSAFRPSLGNAAPLILRGAQRRWAQVHDVRFLVTHQQADRITQRYQDKLDRKAREYVRVLKSQEIEN